MSIPRPDRGPRRRQPPPLAAVASRASTRLASCLAVRASCRCSVRSSTAVGLSGESTFPRRISVSGGGTLGRGILAGDVHDFVAQFDALVADVSFRTGDQLLHVLLRLPAKGATGLTRRCADSGHPRSQRLPSIETECPGSRGTKRWIVALAVHVRKPLIVQENPMAPGQFAEPCL